MNFSQVVSIFDVILKFIVGTRPKNYLQNIVHFEVAVMIVINSFQKAGDLIHFRFICDFLHLNHKKGQTNRTNEKDAQNRRISLNNW